MLKQLIGATLGTKLVKASPIAGGATGVALSTAIPFIISRVSIPAMIVVGAGGYLAKRYFDKNSSKGEMKQITSQTATPQTTPQTTPRTEAPKSKTGTIINPPPAA